jgi:hypothetical protein
MAGFHAFPSSSSIFCTSITCVGGTGGCFITIPTPPLLDVIIIDGNNGGLNRRHLSFLGLITHHIVYLRHNTFSFVITCTSNAQYPSNPGSRMLTWGCMPYKHYLLWRSRERGVEGLQRVAPCPHIVHALVYLCR